MSDFDSKQMSESSKPIHRRNVYIIGAQCTGKTTLAKALLERLQQLSSEAFLPDSSAPEPIPRSQHDDTPPPLYTPDLASPEPLLITELARQIIRDNPIATSDIRDSPALSLQLQTSILKAQHAIEAYLHHSSQPKWYLSDRSGLDPLIYTSLLIPPPAYVNLLASSEWDECKEYMREGLVIVCESGVSWLVDDGVRLMPVDAEEWKALHDQFVKVLGEEGIPHTVLPKEVVALEERVDFVLNCLREDRTGETGRD
ncbi:hypothetical protein BJ508DRAFT_414357 [Ascobolus immersus RN42]|uniref:NadR/Ttd14 AAA domain-containing protein n=1 Tax=Ascobolus immersus RN42 TaxID=1160509 RepID=A0A3N4IKF2_ASCIM|nr:hypothetical protein BJ508DRAFT_414357 [Ascobolus immersus RN42]